MGIVNATPDSFSDGGRFDGADEAIAHGALLAAQGAAWIDVGGESTRPGAARVDAELEQARALPVVAGLSAAGVRVSIDTMNSSTARAAVGAGALLVNDVSGGLADPAMLDVLAATEATVALGHWRGPSADMYARAEYSDVVAEVSSELLARAQAAVAAGIEPTRIVLDPGIGFGKTPAQNWAVLNGLPRIVGLGYRVLVGTSRKGFLAEALSGDALTGDASLADRDAATAATSVLAARAGAWAVRVHDVRSTRTALEVGAAWESGGRGLR